MDNKYVSFQNFGGDVRIKFDRRTEDLKRGSMHYYTPNKSDILRILRVFGYIEDKIVILHSDGYSISRIPRAAYCEYIPGAQIQTTPY